jgi:hypothetical protein
MSNYLGKCDEAPSCGCPEVIDPAATFLTTARLGDVDDRSVDTDGDTVADSRLDTFGEYPPGHYLVVFCNDGAIVCSVQNISIPASGYGWSGIDPGVVAITPGGGSSVNCRFQLGFRYDDAFHRVFNGPHASYELATRACIAHQFNTLTTDEIFIQLFDPNNDPPGWSSDIGDENDHPVKNPQWGLYRLDPTDYLVVRECPTVTINAPYRLSTSITNTHPLFSWSLDLEYTWQGVTSTIAVDVAPGATVDVILADNGGTIIPPGTLSVVLRERAVTGASLYSNSWAMEKILSSGGYTFLGNTDLKGDGVTRRWYDLGLRNSGYLPQCQSAPLGGLGQVTIVSFSGVSFLSGFVTDFTQPASPPYDLRIGTIFPIVNCPPPGFSDPQPVSMGVFKVGFNRFTPSSTVIFTLRINSDGANIDVTWTIPP